MKDEPDWFPVTPTERSAFMEWAIDNDILDERTVLQLRAFVASRRMIIGHVRELIGKEYKELREFVHSRTPDQRESGVIAGHKADKLDNVLNTLKLIEEGQA